MFKHEFVFILEATANQNTLSNKYSVLIGQFWTRVQKLCSKGLWP